MFWNPYSHTQKNVLRDVPDVFQNNHKNFVVVGSLLIDKYTFDLPIDNQLKYRKQSQESSSGIIQFDYTLMKNNFL